MTDDYGTPGLREKVIAIICEEWPNMDNEVPSAAIFERLINDGEEVSEEALGDVLDHLAGQGHITLVIDSTPPPSVGRTILGVSSELCP
jgi:hypothetical protein